MREYIISQPMCPICFSLDLDETDLESPHPDVDRLKHLAYVTFVICTCCSHQWLEPTSRPMDDGIIPGRVN